ncbi:methionyl-tRNA formyltransferase [[Mycoplasma] mobile]|uniref:Methionyl-tRNA formyltransferase n=1 Tax=Mycoplasma mobile (strain ATCC 43663 / 163K / NCTC 11711) TaxID=267748 RepID=Q6KHN9_MYCM1|nr:methionyl-tRNA formyltransferase [[Mycoplasma] mobile]AAT27891.1 methionyl-tRNA formyltransferase [Mycoplasma mobile 163K]
MKIILAGTPDFSVPIFEEIIKKYEVVAIITQPDKQANRGLKTQESPVSFLANKYKIKLFKPEKISQIFHELEKLDFDFFLTAAFGQYIPTNILELPKKASLNIHGSLLPKYRGAAPIQHAILNGDLKTGISLIYMTKKMDAGNILKTEEFEIYDNDDADSIFLKMSLIASKKINFWLESIMKNDFEEIVQDEFFATQAPKLLKEDAKIDLEKMTFEEIKNKVRAFSSNPGSYIFLNKKRVKIFRVSLTNKKGLEIKYKNGLLYATKYQIEGKKIVDLN